MLGIDKENSTGSQDSTQDSIHFREQRQLLEKCAATALNSKLIAGQKDYFSKMVVDAVMSLDELLSLKMIGIKKVQGGALEVCAINLFLLFFQ